MKHKKNDTKQLQFDNNLTTLFVFVPIKSHETWTFFLIVENVENRPIKKQ